MYNWDKMKNHVSNWFEYVKENLLKLLAIILIFIMICYLLWLFPRVNILNDGLITEQHVVILGITLENWFTWLSMIGLAFTAMWAIYQFYKSTILKQQEKASEIAKSFSNELTSKCAIVCEVIKCSKLAELLQLDSKGYDSFKVFNTNEIRIIYNDDNFIEKYNRLKKESDLDSIYYRLLESLISNESFKKLMNEQKMYSTENAQALFILNNSNLPFKFSLLVASVLNELEYLCMSLSSQVAGSKYVYQSLHQVFLRTMRCLAIEIAKCNNKHYSDKFYTNAIHVYNEWTNLYMQELKKETHRQNIVNDLLNPKIKTV